MSAHTPGPWAYCARLSWSENHRGFYVKSNKFVVAYDVIPVDSDGKEGEANARLIAAAPELLEALEKIITRATNHPDDDDADRKRNLYHVQSIALDAIKKATGAA